MEKKIKKIIKKHGYNRYVRDVVCEYFLFWHVYKGAKDSNESPSRYINIRKTSKERFDDLLSKEDILKNVIPSLLWEI